MRRRLGPAWALAAIMLLPMQSTVTADSARAKVESCFVRLLGARTTVPRAPEDYRGDLLAAGQFAGLQADISQHVAPAIELVGMAAQPQYRTALLSELHGRNPAYRGLACEALGASFDVDAVEPLGALLDDTSTSAPVIDYQLPQAGPGNPVWFTPPVSQVARKALISLISIDFQSKTGFDAWWKSNHRHEDKLWYWAAKWSSEWRESHLRPIVLGVSSAQPPAFADIGDLADLPEQTALKLLLLVQDQSALEAEFKAAVGSASGVTTRFAYPTQIGPSSDAVAEFIKSHQFKPKLLALLRQQGLYPEIVSGEAFAGLVQRVAGIADGVFSPDDEPQIAAAQQINSPFKAPQQSFAFIRTAAAPGRAQLILADTLRSDPTLIDVCTSLIQLTGSAETEAIEECFRRASDYGRESICNSIKGTVQGRRPIDKAFLSDLIQMLTFNDQHAPYNTTDSLRLMAEAARIVVGPDAASEEDLRSITPVGIKGPSDEQKQANAHLADGFAAVKAKLLAALK